VYILYPLPKILYRLKLSYLAGRMSVFSYKEAGKLVTRYIELASECRRLNGKK